jgi:alpha-tubulin suppressor-like RCC1 family protein
VRNDDQRVCWGSQNDAGQFGDNTVVPNPVPVVLGTPPLLAIAARGNHACALTEGLQIACWGGNAFEQSGVANDNTVRPQ